MKIAPDGAGFFLPGGLQTPQECGMNLSRRLRPAGEEKDQPGGASFMG